jgi:hypothetical protein
LGLFAPATTAAQCSPSRAAEIVASSARPQTELAAARLTQALSAAAAPAATPALTSAATVTPTPTPGPLVRWKADIDTGTGFVKSLGLFILAVLALLVGVVAGFRLVYLLFGRVRARILVIPDLTNNSGVADLDKMLSALTIVARQKLPQALQQIQSQLKTNKDTGVPQAMLHLAPVPQDVPDDSFQALADAVVGVGSSQIQGIARLVNALIPPRGLVINGYLMLRGQSPGTFGVALHLSALSQTGGGARFVLWEWPQPGHEQDSPGALPGHPAPSRLHRLLVALGLAHDPPPRPKPDPGSTALTTLGNLYRERGAFADAKTQYEAAMQKAPADGRAAPALASVLRADWTPAQRVLLLLEPVIVWMAVEVARRAVRDARPYRRSRGRPMRRGSRWTSNQIDDYEARLDNFFGAFYASRAQGLSYPPFFAAAIPLYRRATRRLPMWY